MLQATTVKEAREMSDPTALFELNSKRDKLLSKLVKAMDDEASNFIIPWRKARELGLFPLVPLVRVSLATPTTLRGEKHPAAGWQLMIASSHVEHGSMSGGMETQIAILEWLLEEIEELSPEDMFA